MKSLKSVNARFADANKRTRGILRVCNTDIRRTIKKFQADIGIESAKTDNSVLSEKEN